MGRCTFYAYCQTCTNTLSTEFLALLVNILDVKECRVRPEVVTYVAGTFCSPCVRVGP